MPTTPIQALPYPGGADAPAGPAQIKALAEAVETRTAMRFASIAERDAKLPAGQRVAGMIAWVDADQTYYVWSTTGSPSWKIVWRDSGWQTAPLAPGFSGQLCYRRVGMQVEVQCNVTSAAGFPQGATQINATPLPAEVRPPGNRRGGAGLSGNTTGATGVSTSGAVFVIHQSGATRAGADGSCVYFLD